MCFHNKFQNLKKKGRNTNTNKKMGIYISICYSNVLTKYFYTILKEKQNR